MVSLYGLSWQLFEGCRQIIYVQLFGVGVIESISWCVRVYRCSCGALNVFSFLLGAVRSAVRIQCPMPAAQCMFAGSSASNGPVSNVVQPSAALTSLCVHACMKSVCAFLQSS